MADIPSISKLAHNAEEWLWRIAGSPDSPADSENVIQPLNIQKEETMMKMGNHDEKKIGPKSESLEFTEQRSNGETVIGEHISIEGTVRADEDILIDGMLKGTIEVKSHRLAVGPKGKIEADVEAENVSIGGKMVGNILAHNKVHITQFADFTGQIKARRIAIEDGAYLKATIELQRDETVRPATAGQAEAIVFDKEETPAAQASKDVSTKRQAL
jgi:cytoskeletal protein CcmA (bactofilin family)